jgi:hypothetical protein
MGRNFSHHAAAAAFVAAALSASPTAIAAACLIAALTKDRRFGITAMLCASSCNANFIPLNPEIRESRPHATTETTNPTQGEIAFDKVGETSFMMGAAGMLMHFNITHEIASLDKLTADLRDAPARSQGRPTTASCRHSPTTSTRSDSGPSPSSA